MLEMSKTFSKCIRFLLLIRVAVGVHRSDPIPLITSVAKNYPRLNWKTKIMSFRILIETNLCT